MYLRDKAVVFDEERTGFVMYGVQGRTWAAMGDPVGPDDRIPALIRAFLERCDEFGGRPVFYEIRKDYLHHYADFGLAFVKIGEDARVDLPAFRLDGGRARGLRQALARLAKERAVFRVAPAAEVPSLAGALREVSDDWLAHRATAEKGFSLGFFDESYLARFPTALVERDGRVEAFATLWPGPGKVELSLDLMRHRHDAPANVMESLTVHLIRWGQAEGYRWLSLGMAPMSGFEQSPVAPLWTRARIVPVLARWPALQFSGPAHVQGEVRAHLGSALPRVSGRPDAAAHSCRRLRHRRRRVSAHSDQGLSRSRRRSGGHRGGLMHAVVWILSALVAGMLARIAMGGRYRGFVGDVALGALGSVTGAWLLRMVHGAVPAGTFSNVASALAGAIFVVAVGRLLRDMSRGAGRFAGERAQAGVNMVADVEAYVRRLPDLERKVLARVLGRGPLTRDPNEQFRQQWTLGDHLADRVARFGGSWTFLGLFGAFLLGWIFLNTQVQRPIDPYPFILLNLVLSCMAAVQAPVIMMSQNRQAARDRFDAQQDYQVNLRAEMQILALHGKLDEARTTEWQALVSLHQQQVEILQRIERAMRRGPSRPDVPSPEDSGLPG